MAEHGHFEEHEVWGNDEDGVCSYFVYSLGVTNRGTALAFAEGRLGPGDTDPHHLVLKRSADGGRSWGSSQVLQSGDRGEVWAQPLCVVDSHRDRVIFVYCLNLAGRESRVFCTRSDDDGLSWGNPVELSALFEENEHGWLMHAPGPGHGIQLGDGTLVMQLWHRTVPVFDASGAQTPPRKRNYGVSVISSDDGGSTWRPGGTVPRGSTFMLNEAKLVELESGEILMNARSSGESSRRRVVSRSADGGLTWSNPVFDPSIPEHVGCDAGLIRVTRRPGSDRSRIAYCRPDDLHERKNLTVSISYDECRSWTYRRVVTPGDATYSDLAVLPDHTLLCLYGKGRTRLPSGKRAISSAVCARFDVEWVSDGEDRVQA